jgi:hypothetical protein
LIFHSIVAWRFVVSCTQKSLNIHRNTAPYITAANQTTTSWATYFQSYVEKVTLLLSTPLKRIWEWRYSSTYSRLRH